MKLLVIGGYGTFGGRIVDLLKDEARLSLIVAGRSLDKAQAFCAARADAQAAITAARFDRDGDLSLQVAAHAPDAVIDASGPFQAYGDDRYRLIEACIAARVNYLDLADGAAFVEGVAHFDAAARAAGIYVLTGVSSFPVLTAAVVRRLAQDMARVDSIAGGIAPSPYAGVGENVVHAIASYAGQKVAYLGRTAKVIGRPFTQQRRVTIAPPGRLPLKSTMFSLVDVPDLRALSALWPDARRVWMGAGPVPEVLHRALIGLAWLVSFGWLRSLTPFAPLMHWAANRLCWGEHRGGMFVKVTGARADGAKLSRTWCLLAEGDDGPLIPAMAVEAIVRNQLAERTPSAGARAATGDVELEDYERLFAGRAITTGVREPATGALYPSILGAAFARLPIEIQHMHDGADGAVAEGVGTVERGGNPLAHLACAIMGFPPAGADVPVRVEFRVKEGAETWRRTFAKVSFASRQYAGRGRSDALLCERFGPLEFAMALLVENGSIELIVRRWSAFGIAMPVWLAPRSIGRETVEDGVFRFFVEISHPLVGLIVRYNGWLRRA